MSCVLVGTMEINDDDDYDDDDDDDNMSVMVLSSTLEGIEVFCKVYETKSYR